MSVLYTDTKTLLRLAKLHVMRELSLPAERVLLVADWAPYQQIQGDQVVEIRPGYAVRRSGWSDGHSRNATWMARDIYMRLTTRLALDPVSEDDIWLTDPALGHYQKEEILADIFDDWCPLINDAAVLVQPSKVIDCWTPEKKDRSPGWGFSIVQVQLDYLQAKKGGRTIITGI